jgi:hypothetical protein
LQCTTRLEDAFIFACGTGTLFSTGMLSPYEQIYLCLDRSPDYRVVEHGLGQSIIVSGFKTPHAVVVCACERLYRLRQAVCVPDEPGQTYRTSQAKSKTLRPTSDVWDPRKSLHRANGRHTVNGQALRSVLLRLSVTFLPVPNRQVTRTPSCGQVCPESAYCSPVHVYSYDFRHLSTYIARSVQMDSKMNSSQFKPAVKMRRRKKKRRRSLDFGPP